MSETLSTMLPLGTIAPDFTLMDTCSQRFISLKEFNAEQAIVIMFICNHCPYVKHIKQKLITLAKEYQEKGVSFVAISSNDANKYVADSPENMKIEAETWSYPFPYLYDETQAVAKAYHAACTPDFYVFDKNLACVYRGRFDDSTPGNNSPVTGLELSQALDQILAGKDIDSNQKPSVGCNIKWR